MAALTGVGSALALLRGDRLFGVSSIAFGSQGRPASAPMRMSRWPHRSLLWLQLALGFWLSGWPAQAGSLEAIASFDATTGDRPYSSVIFDNAVGRRGVLYATTTGDAGVCYTLTHWEAEIFLATD